MMKKTIALFYCLFVSFISGQVPVNNTTELNELALTKKNGLLKIDAEKHAVFPLGTVAFRNMLLKNFRTDKISDSSDIHCDLLFVIDREGEITEIKANGPNEEFNNEAVFALSQIKEKWIPATLNGVPVKYRMKVPLDMKFSNPEELKPTFPAGEEAFKKMIINNLKPKNIQGKKSCIISFIVDYSGKIRNIGARGEDRKFNKDVKQAVSKINEKWTPRIFHGVPIQSIMEINFEIN